MGESAVQDVYDLVYEAHRPELFLKDAASRRTVGPGEPIGIRGDSTWNVPEPEIGVVVGERGKILAYTIGNDMSSREIEGANPLYLSQAKVYAAACSIGPALYIPPREPQGFQIIMRISDAEGEVLYEDKTSTTLMVRTVRRACLVARPREPRAARIRPPDGDGPRPARLVQPRPGQLGRDPRAGGRDAREPGRAGDDPPLNPKEGAA